MSDLSIAVKREGLPRGDLSTTNDYRNSIETFKLINELTFKG